MEQTMIGNLLEKNKLRENRNSKYDVKSEILKKTNCERTGIPNRRKFCLSKISADSDVAAAPLTYQVGNMEFKFKYSNLNKELICFWRMNIGRNTVTR